MIFRIGPGSVMKAISRMSPPQFGHSSGNSSPTRARSFAHAIRAGRKELALPGDIYLPGENQTWSGTGCARHSKRVGIATCPLNPAG